MNGKQFFDVEFYGVCGRLLGKGVMTPTEAIMHSQGRLVRFGGPIPCFEAWTMTPQQRGLPA